MLKYHAPPILILLHLHLVNNVNLHADEASASALLACVLLSGTRPFLHDPMIVAACRCMTGWNSLVEKAKSVPK